MKKMLIILSSMILAVSLAAAKLPIQKGQHGYQIMANKSTYLELEYRVSDLDLKEVQTEKGAFTSIYMKNGYLTNQVGAPAEPEFHNLIELPLGATPEVEVISYDTKEIDLSAEGYRAPLMPAQPSYEKSIDPKEIYTHYNEALYKTNRYSSNKIAEATVSGNSRGRTIADLTIRTTRYNPGSNRLTVINNIRVRIKFDGGVANPRQAVASCYSPYFDDTYIINPTKLTKVDYTDLVKYPVTYLLVANSGLQNNAKLLEFIAWKKQKGFNVVEKYVASATSENDIDTWIESQYNTLTPKPSFVLLVGDMDGTYAVKTQTTGLTSGISASDLRYGVIGTMSSSNSIPSMYVGRFSVRTLADLEAQVDKTIWYEKTQFTSSANLDYLKNAMVTAGADGTYQATYGNPHVKYAMAWHFNDTFINPTTGTTNGVTGIGHLNGGTGQAANIRTTVNNGVSYYNYTAHGGNDQFVDPNFNITHVDALTNEGKYGLIIGNCCVTGSFGDPECFGESWLNAPKKGAIGYIGSTMNTTWNEDLAMGIGSEGAGQVVSGDITPAFTPNTPGMPDGLMLQKFPTQGGVRHVGLLAVETYGGDKFKYWQAYHLFGDPSLMPYVGIPKTIEVTHLPTVTPGVATFTVNAVKNAYVALSDAEGVLHGAALADENGVATVTITPFISGVANLVVYAPMKKPVFKAIPVASLNGPFIVRNSFVVNNNNFGQNCTIDLRLKNIGNATSTNLVVTPTIDPTDASFATITSGVINYGNIAAGDSTMITSAITVAIASTVPDQEAIKINLVMVDNVTKKTYEGNLSFVANAPVLEYSLNTNGTVMPGDTKDLVYSVKNSGHAAISNINTNFTQTTAFPITIGTPQQTAASIGANETKTFTHSTAFGATIALGTKSTFNFHFTANNGIEKNDVQNVMIGVTQALFFENFEGTFPPAGWVNSSNPGWEQGTTEGLNGSKCAKAKYTPVGIRTLTTKAFDLRNTGSDTLSFWWKDDDITKIVAHDTTWCDITADGTTWTNIGLLSAAAHETQYNKFEYPLPEMYETANFKIRWRDKTDATYSAYGTGVDNVLIRGYVSTDSNSIDDAINASKESSLFQNYPNPFNPETTIKFYNHENNMVKLAVYNLKGELVANLVNSNLNQGIHNYTFKANGLASGVYVYKLQIGTKSIVKSMLLLK